MITLFDPNETDFTHNGLGTLDKNIINSVVEEDLNGIFSLSFEYPIFALHGLEIDGQSIIRSPVPDGPDQLFRVYKPTKSMGYLKVECYHVFYDLIDNFIEDTNIVSKDGQTALAQMGSKTQYGHNFRFFSDITTIAGSRVVRKNPIEFLLDYSLENSFVNRWGGELKRNNFDVSMYNSIGIDKGVTIRHKKDLLGYEAVVDWHSPVTRTMPIGFDGLLLPEKYIDSPVINSYVKPKIQKIEYGDVKAAIGQYADDKEAVPLEQAYTELRRLAKLEYSKGKIDYPKASYKVEFVTLSKTEEYKDYISLETVALGDTVTVIHSEDNLDIKAKVIKYRFDPLVKKYIDIELGNFKETFSDTQSKIDSIYNHVEEVKQDISLTIQVSADGKNTIYRGVATPVNARVGDLWYKPIDNGNTEMYIYTDDPIVPWQLIFSTASLDEVSKEVDAVIADMIVEKERINQTITKADQAIADAGFAKLDATTAKNNAVTAVNTANTAKTNAEKAISDVGVMSPKVTKAVADASAAMLSVDVAKSNSEKALTVSQNSLTNSDEALIKAGQALGKATATEITTASLITSYDYLTKTVSLKAEKEELNVLKGTVTQQGIGISANATAVGLKADKTLVNSIKGTVDKHTLDIKASADGLLLKADSSLVNTLKGTVDSQGLAITAASNGLTLKADTTVVNTIKGTVDTHTNQIKVVSDGLALKAESSLVNAIKGTVDSHTNQIGVNSQAIEARLTSIQVDSILTAKKYVNETQLKASADGLQVGITKVTSDLANLEIGGRNLLPSFKNPNWNISNTITVNNYELKIPGVSFNAYIILDVTPYTKYTMTFNSDYCRWWVHEWRNGVRGRYLNKPIVEGSDVSTIITTDVTQVEVQINTYSQNVPLNRRVWNPKFEKGNKATDWTPAPEDMTTKVETADLEFKVDGIKTEFVNKTNTIEGINTTQTANILANANGLKTKAETTTVNSIKGTVDIHTGQISANATGLTSKAETSVVNAIKGTVDSHTTQISQNSTAIGLRLTSAQVESAITAKKYVNETTFNATSSGLTASIASTDLELGKSNTRITNVEATANGLQTTVKNKAEQSQVTQIASQVASKVEGSVYNTKMTQLDSAINLRLTTGQVNESILADKQIKDTRTTNQLPNWYYANYPKQTVEEFKQRAEMGVPGAAVYGQLTTQVQWDSSTGGSMTQIFNSSDGVFQRKSNVNNTWTAWEQTAEVSKIVAQINLSPKGVFIQGKNIQLDGDVAMDNAFVNRIKAIEVIADKITTGTLNGANVNLINLNASSITAGTFRGANYELDLNTGTQIFRNPNNGNSLIMNQGVIGFWNENKSRYIEYWDEGLKIYPGSQNTGIAANTGLQLIGGHAYIDFVSNLNGNGVYQRLEASSGNMYIIHHADGSLRVRGFNGLESNGRITTGFFKTSHPQNATLTMWGDTINVPNDGNRNIHLVPNGTGSVIIGTWQGTRWNIQASDFVKVSSRATKTNIVPLDNGLSTINSLLAVTYNKIDKLNRGINELEKGFIAEDSPSVSTPDGKGIYDSFIVAHLVKGMQELDARTASETDILKSRVTKLEQKIKLLESAA